MLKEGSGSYTQAESLYIDTVVNAYQSSFSDEEMLTWGTPDSDIDLVFVIDAAMKSGRVNTFELDSSDVLVPDGWDILDSHISGRVSDLGTTDIGEHERAYVIALSMFLLPNMRDKIVWEELVFVVDRYTATNISALVGRGWEFHQIIETAHNGVPASDLLSIDENLLASTNGMV